jgi:hypothetical protein
MTDARIPERWLNDRRLQRLSAEHYRSFFNALLWSVANRTDGRIEREDLGLIPHWSAHAVKAFVDAGLFTPLPEGWLIVDYASTQTSRDELEMLQRMRDADRRRKKEKRSRPTDCPRETPADSPGDIPGDESGGQSTRTAQAGRQAGRQAKDEASNWPSGNGTGHEREDWSTVAVRTRIDQNVRDGYDR